MMTVKRPFRMRTQPAKIVSRIPRVARLMGLAIRFDELIRDGVVKDQAELASLGQVSRARVTQIMDLLNLAPEIQAILLTPGEVLDLSERQLRPIAALACWEDQRRLWAELN